MYFEEAIKKEDQYNSKQFRQNIEAKIDLNREVEGQEIDIIYKDKNSAEYAIEIKTRAHITTDIVYEIWNSNQLQKYNKISAFSGSYLAFVVETNSDKSVIYSVAKKKGIKVLDLDLCNSRYFFDNFITQEKNGILIKSFSKNSYSHQNELTVLKYQKECSDIKEKLNKLKEKLEKLELDELYKEMSPWQEIDKTHCNVLSLTKCITNTIRKLKVYKKYNNDDETKQSISDIIDFINSFKGKLAELVIFKNLVKIESQK